MYEAPADGSKSLIYSGFFPLYPGYLRIFSSKFSGGVWIIQVGNVDNSFINCHEITTAKLYTVNMKTLHSDLLLIKYKYEMENNANDGWTKLHYTKMYEERLSQLIALSKGWDPSDGPESLDEM